MTNNTIPVDPRIRIALEQSEHHRRLAAESINEAERKAHEATMRALDKVAMEFVKGNYPRHVAGDEWLIGSRSTGGVVYRVNHSTGRCNCDSRGLCWHMVAVDVCEGLRTRESARESAITRLAKLDEVADLINEDTVAEIRRDIWREFGFINDPDAVEPVEDEPVADGYEEPFTRADEDRCLAIADYYEGELAQLITDCD